MTRKRLLLSAVAVLLSLSALLAIAILLVGRLGSMEGRILATTALLAGYALVALPAVVLLDQERSRGLAASSAGLAALAAAVALVSVWSPSGSDTVGRMVGSTAISALAVAQAAAMSARRRERDLVSVRRLFALSCITAACAAGFAVTLLWLPRDGGEAARFLAALLVLDLLLVALQPLLARARAGGVVRRITVVLASGKSVEIEVAARDLASAAARAIRSVERADDAVVELKIAQSRNRRRAAETSERDVDRLVHDVLRDDRLDDETDRYDSGKPERGISTRLPTTRATIPKNRGSGICSVRGRSIGERPDLSIDAMSESTAAPDTDRH